MTTRNIIRSIYFYAAALITLIMIVVSAGQLVDIALKSTVFPKAEDPYGQTCNEKGELVYKGEIAPRPVMTPEGESEEQAPEKEMTAEEKAAAKAECMANLAERRSAERQSRIVNALSMLIVATPVFWFHFRVAQREREEEKGRSEKDEKTS